MAENTYVLSAVNDGSGNYTTETKRGGTKAADGTALTYPGSDAGATATKNIGLALMKGVRAILNDKAAGN